jgi:hypothetical protein
MLKEANLPTKAKARYDALQQEIKDGTALVAADAEEIRRAMFRCGGDEASPELITLKARQDMRQRKLASDKSMLARAREFLAKLPGNAILVDVDPDDVTASDVDGLDATRAKIRVLREEATMLMQAPPSLAQKRANAAAVLVELRRGVSVGNDGRLVMAPHVDVLDQKLAFYFHDQMLAAINADIEARHEGNVDEATSTTRLQMIARELRALEVAEESAVRLATRMGRDVIRRFSARRDAHGTAPLNTVLPGPVRALFLTVGFTPSSLPCDPLVRDLNSDMRGVTPISSRCRWARMNRGDELSWPLYSKILGALAGIWRDLEARGGDRHMRHPGHLIPRQAVSSPPTASARSSQVSSAGMVRAARKSTQLPTTPCLEPSARPGPTSPGRRCRRRRTRWSRV